MDVMQMDIIQMKEDAGITREGVNSLLEWAEECGNAVKFPLSRIARREIR